MENPRFRYYTAGSEDLFQRKESTMSDGRSKPSRKRVGHYDVQYANFSASLYRTIRAEASGEDFGQNGWLTAEEHDLFLSWLDVGPQSRVLDVACGSGGPTLRLAEKTGCTVHGVDIHARGVGNAASQAAARGLDGRATFQCLDAAAELPFEQDSFTAITCVDAINHLPGRPAVVAEWARVVKPGGRILFTDPIVVTGALSAEEIAIRASIGFFLFVPPGSNEALLRQAGLDLVRTEDRTENMATVARRWHAARQERADDLRSVEGDDTFEGQQEFFAVAARIARQRRLSRYAYLAVKPG